MLAIIITGRPVSQDDEARALAEANAVFAAAGVTPEAAYEGFERYWEATLDPIKPPLDRAGAKMVDLARLWSQACMAAMGGLQEDETGPKNLASACSISAGHWPLGRIA